MLRMDCHIHTECPGVDTQSLCSAMKAAGLDGGTVISVHPGGLMGETGLTWEERLADVLRTAAQEHLYPFYFVDPTEPDAIAQVTEAARRGIRGIKIICNRFYPGNERAMPVYRRIAQLGLPLMFHAGILHDGINASGRYNRPCEFEPLLAIPGLRFSLAHIAWPWTDECIAVFGKLAAYRRHAEESARCADLYIDLTPGTPGIYRKEAVARLLSAGGKEVVGQILWGDDNSANEFDTALSRHHIVNDEVILEELTGSREILPKLFEENYFRFIGV